MAKMVEKEWILSSALLVFWFQVNARHDWSFVARMIAMEGTIESDVDDGRK